ncbi:MAG: LON peptidase substrate-binding domain-containing protein [Gammaproteobacteria bacterium]|nr:LON peptidase substrate-binding domain-containing protein [Gammaproteobacteria bacterium]
MDTDPGRQRVALFPLNLVLFPGGLLPLRIFEPRYQRMVSECLREQQPFAVVSIVDGPEAGGVAATAQTGTLARIIDFERGDDGLLNLLCEGGRRIRVASVQVEHDDLLRADVEHQPDQAPAALPPELAWTAQLLDELLDRVGEPFDRLRVASPSADHVAHRLIELLPIPLAEKQALFDLDDGGQRLRRLAGLINPAHGDSD